MISIGDCSDGSKSGFYGRVIFSRMAKVNVSALIYDAKEELEEKIYKLQEQIDAEKISREGLEKQLKKQKEMMKEMQLLIDRLVALTLNQGETIEAIKDETGIKISWMARYMMEHSEEQKP